VSWHGIWRVKRRNENQVENIGVYKEGMIWYTQLYCAHHIDKGEIFVVVEVHDENEE